MIHLDVNNPKMMFIVGCVGLGLNLISAIFLHGMVLVSRISHLKLTILEHGHGHDLGPPSIETPAVQLGESCQDSHAVVCNNTY
jgi:zinc transporter 1